MNKSTKYNRFSWIFIILALLYGLTYNILLYGFDMKINLIYEMSLWLLIFSFMFESDYYKNLIKDYQKDKR